MLVGEGSRRLDVQFLERLISHTKVNLRQLTLPKMTWVNK